ncbi:uncharacterized protein V1510DRAFT_409879 [Dipodascopsis tothii]|uniref:uncharacterized protein n=1 Tax=Dipodascopsis tothii TaxID=44089 RepID=UPI0034CD7AA7
MTLMVSGPCDHGAGTPMSRPQRRVSMRPRSASPTGSPDGREIYALAAPPPSRTAAARRLVFQVQRLTVRRALPVFDIVADRGHAPLFLVYACDLDASKLVARATADGLSFGNNERWTIARGPIGMAVADGAGRAVGLWTARDHDWTMVGPDGRELASLRHGCVTVRADAGSGYVGAVRFEEALIFAAVYVAGLVAGSTTKSGNTTKPGSATKPANTIKPRARSTAAPAPPSPPPPPARAATEPLPEPRGLFKRGSDGRPPRALALGEGIVRKTGLMLFRRKSLGRHSL